MRIPFVKSLHIEKVSGASIEAADFLNKNAVIGEYTDGRMYASQRPSVDIWGDASADVSKAKGRGVYYWEKASAWYIVNDNYVYQTSYAGAIVNEPTDSIALTGTGTVATATAVAHGYTTGDKVTVTAAGSDPNYEVTDVVITVTSADVFKYASTGTGADTATVQRNLGPGGTAPIYFVEMVNYLVILDPENNQGWYIHSGALTTLVQITDANFPGQASNTEELATGGAFLDGRLYVATTVGAIYGSDASTPVTWEPLNKISAEREADSGIHLDKHHEHIVLFGSRTIEFFYNASNPTASPLSRRPDVSYNFGLLQGDTVFREGDDLYFVGIYPSGTLSVQVMSNFKLQPISTPDIESYLTNARIDQSALVVGSGFTTASRTYYLLTLYRLSAGLISPDITIAFDSTSWSIWETTVAGHTKFPLMSWNIRSGTGVRSGAGILSNGDLISITDDLLPVDSLLGTTESYITTGYVAAGYYLATAPTLGETVNIDFKIRTGPVDGQTSRWKFMHNLEVAGDETGNTDLATIKWADGNSLETNFNTGRTVRLDRKEKVTRLGRFKRRNFEFSYSGSEQLRLEGLDVEITEGEH